MFPTFHKMKIDENFSKQPVHAPGGPNLNSKYLITIFYHHPEPISLTVLNSF